MGFPRSTVPIRVVTPLGDFELRPQRYRWLGWVLILVMLAPLMINWIASLIRTR